MRQTRGIGLIEVLVAIAILAVVLAAVVPSFLFYLRTNTKSETRTQAVAAAQVVLEDLRLQDPTLLPSSGSTTRSVTIAGRSFNVVTTFCPTGSTLCSANARHVRVEVLYKGKKVYEVETVYTKLR